MGRDKAAKFTELANKRVNKVIKELKLIGNLANRKNYDFSEEQAKKIVKALQKEVDAIRHGFQAAMEEGADEFRL